MNTTSGVTKAPDHHLQEAVGDSQYLLAYFSRARVDIPAEKHDEFKKSVKILSSFRPNDPCLTQPQTGLAAGHVGDAGNSTPASTDAIAEFWNAFIFLSDLAYPATIESIRYYFRFYSSLKDGGRKRRHGQRFKLPSYTYLTFAALLMTIGLSLLSYIGSTALVGYDADFAHWSQVQMLVRYLDEGGKANFTPDQTEKGRRLAITFEAANASTQANSTTRIMQSADNTPDTLHSNSTTPGSARNTQDISFEVPATRVSRITTVLADNDLRDKPAVDFAYACQPIFKIFAKAQGEELPKPDVPVLPGGPTQNDCETLIMKTVKPMFSPLPTT
jgi:hypothetical protein